MVEAAQLLAIDLGQKRTGIARASSVARLAEPLKTVPTEELIETLRKISAEQSVEKVIVGLPRNLNGNETEQTRWVRHWLQDAKIALPELNFFLQDEALTSVTAIDKGSKNVTDIDAAAAAIILQDFLDEEEYAQT